MKIAVPTENGNLCPHFGHCQVFTFLEVNDEDKTITRKTEKTPPPHEPGVLPAWLAEEKADLIIAGALGPRAIDLLKEAGIDLIYGAPVASPEELAKQYLEGSLSNGENRCTHED